MHARPRHLVACLPLVPALVGCAFGSCTMQRHFVSIGEVELRHPALGVEQLQVATNVGDVRVEHHQGDEVEIRAHVMVPEEFAKALAPADPDRDVIVSLQGATLKIRNAHLDDIDDDDWHVAFTVRVPAVKGAHLVTGVGNIDVALGGEQLELVAGVGDVTSRGNVARMKASSGVGDVDLDGSFQTVEATSGTGDIKVTAAALQGGQLRTGVGSVQLTAREGVTGDLRCVTGTGDVTLDLPDGWDGSFSLETGVGSVAVPGGMDARREERTTGATVTGQGQAPARLTVGTGVGTIRWR